MTAASAQICARASSFTSVRRDNRPIEDVGSGAEERRAPWWVATFLAGGFAVTLIWNAALSWVLWRAIS